VDWIKKASETYTLLEEVALILNWPRRQEETPIISTCTYKEHNFILIPTLFPSRVNSQPDKNDVDNNHVHATSDCFLDYSA
jgi:hypothetical protein